MSDSFAIVNDVRCRYSGEVCPAKQCLVDDYRADEDMLAELGEAVREEDLQQALMVHDQHAPTKYCVGQACKPETIEEPLNWAQKFMRFVVDHATR